MTRQVDELGRIVVPAEIRDQLGMTPGVAVEWLLGADGTLGLQVAAHRCRLCGAIGGTVGGVTLHGAWVCRNCAAAVSRG